MFNNLNSLNCPLNKKVKKHSCTLKSHDDADGSLSELTYNGINRSKSEDVKGLFRACEVLIATLYASLHYTHCNLGTLWLTITLLFHKLTFHRSETTRHSFKQRGHF